MVYFVTGAVIILTKLEDTDAKLRYTPLFFNQTFQIKAPKKVLMKAASVED